uniref:hypothetical protein n=1 Tax=Streptococcus ferus TaxID=1345 RepID=UPI0035A159CE
KKNNDALRATYPDYANDLERLKAYNAEHSDNALTGEKAATIFSCYGKPSNFAIKLCLLSIQNPFQQYQFPIFSI